MPITSNVLTFGNTKINFFKQHRETLLFMFNEQLYLSKIRNELENSPKE